LRCSYEITADIARECANDVIKELKALDVHHRGAITLEILDTVLSTRAHKAEDEATPPTPWCGTN
jgi:hypothetical protein